MKKYILLAFILIFGALDSPEISIAQSWIQTNGPTDAEFYSIAFNTKKDMFVIAEGLLMRSTDNGASWKRLGSQLGLINRIVIASNNDIYVTIFSYSSSGTQSYKSTYNGDSWNRIFSKDVIIDATHDSTIYAVNAYSNSDFYFLRSSDLGKTWDSLSCFVPTFGLDSN